MHVWHGLPSVLTVIDDQAIARIRDAEFAPESCGDDEKVPEHLLMCRFDVGNARDRVDGHDEHMNGRLRLNIAECDAEFIPIDDVGRDFARDDPAEEGRLLSHGTRLRTALHR